MPGFTRACMDAWVCSGMSQSGVAGDELTMRAISDHFGVPINIITADDFMWCSRYAPKQTKSQRELFVALVAPTTFFLVRWASVVCDRGREGRGGESCMCACYYNGRLHRTIQIELTAACALLGVCMCAGSSRW